MTSSRFEPEIHSEAGIEYRVLSSVSRMEAILSLVSGALAEYKRAEIDALGV
jgi:hypothetical protein